MTFLEWMLISSIIILAIDLVRAERNVISLKKRVSELYRKYNSADRDIKTLHFNQKMLQSTIKEFHKDLKIYGEVKRSKVKELFSETPKGE